MKTDIPSLVGAVTREVREAERDGLPTRAVIAARHYDTSLDDAWDALTNPERIPRWFLPVTGDLRVGGRYQLQGNAGGEITRCEPPTLLAMTWEFGGQTSWVEVRLTARDGGTHLELQHTVPVDEHWGQYGPGAVGVGWELGLFGLQKHLSTGAAVDPAQFEAWSASDEGKAFVRGSSEDWCRAAIAGGTSRDQAEAAAARTTAAYTGEASDPESGATSGASR